MSTEFIGLLGGSALLLYSMGELSRSVQYLAGAKFRAWLNAFSNSRFIGVLLGVALAVLLSSSGAVTVMLVGLANARLLTLEQVFSVTLGASVGSTFIVYLFAFRISEYGLLILAVGVTVERLMKSDRAVRVGRFLLFLGMLFFSMGLLVDSGRRLETNEFFRYVVTYFHGRPGVSFFIAAVLTVLVQSSAATMGFVIALMTARGDSIYEALPWILGANLGTTATAFIAGLKEGVLGKQAAVGHFLFKVIGIVACFPFMPEIASLIARLHHDVAVQVALAHTFFNSALAIVYFPFIGWGVKIVRQLIPETRDQGPFTFHYLDDRTLTTPELALAQAQREILRLSDTVEKMVEKCIHLFEKATYDDLEALKAMDQVVDYLNRGIKLYLTKLSQNEMSPEQAQKEFEFLIRTNDLENIGDIIDKNILELVRKKLKKGYSFSKEGWAEIRAFHEKVVHCLRVSTAYFNSRDRELLVKILVLYQEIEDMSLSLSEHHVQRLHRGVKESLDTTAVHWDLLGYLQRIAGMAVNFCRLYGNTNEFPRS